jgi:hypothetical protein
VIATSHILKTMDRLERLYRTAPTSQKATWYSKLAIIEGCGWIELTMDSIVQTYANRTLKTAAFQNSFETVISNNHGFAYPKNFRSMMIKTLGLRAVEQIQTRVNRSGKIDILRADLEALEIDRNDASHTFVDATKSYPAPSLTKGRIVRVADILKDIDKEVRRLRPPVFT